LSCPVGKKAENEKGEIEESGDLVSLRKAIKESHNAGGSLAIAEKKKEGVAASEEILNEALHRKKGHRVRAVLSGSFSLRRGGRVSFSLRRRSSQKITMGGGESLKPILGLGSVERSLDLLPREMEPLSYD